MCELGEMATVGRATRTKKAIGARDSGNLPGFQIDVFDIGLYSVEDVPKPALKRLILAAAKLNKKEPMEGMKLAKEVK